MEAYLQALENWPLAQYLRFSRWPYAVLNAVHILAISLLVGSSVAMSLRMLARAAGYEPTFLAVSFPGVMRMLAPIAATGLTTSVITGFLLFSVRAADYADLTVFRVKLALIAVAALSAIIAHWRHGWALDGVSPGRLKVHAIVSLCGWTAALLCGRLIAFAGS